MKCEVCGNENIEEKGLGIVYCTKCQAPYHYDCWNYAKKCARYGCENTEFQSGKVELESAEKIFAAKRSFFEHIGEYFSFICAVLLGLVSLKVVWFVLGLLLAQFNGCDAGFGQESNLVYSPALNEVVCYRDELGCIDSNRPCLQLLENVVDHEYGDHQKVYRATEVEFNYLHPYCYICGRYNPQNPCVHLRWLLEPSLEFTKPHPGKFCSGRFYDCFRENKPCIKKILSGHQKLLNIIEIKLHPQCTACGHWLSEGLCNHKPNLRTQEQGSLNCFALIRFKQAHY